MTNHAPLPSETRCAAPGCTTILPPRGRGRPRIYCSPACRTAAQRSSGTEPLAVEVDHGSTDAAARPAGRVWLVRLRRGDRAVIIAAGLGKPSADHLAHQITQLLHPQPWRREALIQ